jgi:hypothetical protein
LDKPIFRDTSVFNFEWNAGFYDLGPVDSEFFGISIRSTGMCPQPDNIWLSVTSSNIVNANPTVPFWMAYDQLNPTGLSLSGFNTPCNPAAPDTVVEATLSSFGIVASCTTFPPSGVVPGNPVVSIYDSATCTGTPVALAQRNSESPATICVNTPQFKEPGKPETLPRPSAVNEIVLDCKNKNKGTVTVATFYNSTSCTGASTSVQFAIGGRKWACGEINPAMSALSVGVCPQQ